MQGEKSLTCSDAFNDKLQATSCSGLDVNNTAFFVQEDKSSCSLVSWTPPARLVSDQLINIFFQEWAPLFPILHKPAFLALYEEYVSCPEAMEDKKSLAQLHLVFSIAAHSSGVCSTPNHPSTIANSLQSQYPKEIESCDSQWQAALEYFLMEGSMATLQSLLLAQICCLQKADYQRLMKYKGLAVSLSQRLGLHQSQKRFTLGALTCETRKRLFWTLYTLDWYGV
jgi:hypothetical protein